ncbi:MAG TPA: NAD(+)/NADH kinase [Candidatus Limnocylindrales bacterium]|jgi:NAD+ kinase
MRRLGFAYNPTNDAAVQLRERALAWCRARDVDGWSEPAGELAKLRRQMPDTNALVVLGGDGTFLLAARAAAEADVPILGVNLGKVGFLSKVEADGFEPVLEEIVGGAYSIDERMTLRGMILPAGGTKGSREVFALNDIVVARGSLARVVRLDLAIGPSHVATIMADGLIVASPTGSTGYSFSAGGPILDPISRNLVVTPIAGYLSAIRSIVASPLQTVKIRVVDAHEALLAVDGYLDIPLNVADVVEVSAQEAPIRFVEPKSAMPFWDLLRHKVELLPS